MGQIKVRFDEASPKQLRQFASETLGIQIAENCNLGTCQAKVREAWKPDFILLLDDTAPAEPAGASPPTQETAGVDGPKPGYVRIVINETEAPGGADRVKLGVNGKAMLIDRNVPSDIPRPYYLVLLEAYEHRYEMMEDGKSMNPVPRKIARYPFSLIAIGPLSQEEKATQARQEKERASLAAA